MKAKGQYSLINTVGMSSAREMRKLKRDRVIKELGLKKRVELPRQKPDFAEVEFNIPDESRNWVIYLKGCPKGCMLARNQIMRVVCKPPARPTFRIQCGNMACNFMGEEFSSSAKAVQNWKVICALMK